MYVACHQKEQELGTVRPGPVIDISTLWSNWGSVQSLQTDPRQKTHRDEQQTVRIKVISICRRGLLPYGSTTCRSLEPVVCSHVYVECG